MAERSRSQGRGKENYFHQSFCWNVFKYKIERKDRKSLVHYKSSWIWCPRKPQALKKCITFSLKKVCCLSSAFCRVSFRVFRKGYLFLAEDFQTWTFGSFVSRQKNVKSEKQSLFVDAVASTSSATKFFIIRCLSVVEGTIISIL